MAFALKVRASSKRDQVTPRLEVRAGFRLSRRMEDEAHDRASTTSSWMACSRQTSHRRFALIDTALNSFDRASASHGMYVAMGRLSAPGFGVHRALIDTLDYRLDQTGSLQHNTVDQEYPVANLNSHRIGPPAGSKISRAMCSLISRRRQCSRGRSEWSSAWLKPRLPSAITVRTATTRFFRKT